mmetsp:Transcript_32877/g.71126  ORF Transcript_32877/g.71126 Transcript_32877/m.71126 type:complete len:205 (+) Transcript_32877:965-1579(+)
MMEASLPTIRTLAATRPDVTRMVCQVIPRSSVRKSMRPVFVTPTASLSTPTSTILTSTLTKLDVTCGSASLRVVMITRVPTTAFPSARVLVIRVRRRAKRANRRSLTMPFIGTLTTKRTVVLVLVVRSTPTTLVGPPSSRTATSSLNMPTVVSTLSAPVARVVLIPSAILPSRPLLPPKRPSLQPRRLFLSSSALTRADKQCTT